MSEYRSTLGDRMATPGRSPISGTWNDEEKRIMNNDELLAKGIIDQKRYDYLKEWNLGAGSDVNGNYIGFPDDFVFPENLKIPEEKK